MKKLPIAVTGGWSYLASVTPVPAVPGQHSLEVSSQWAGAKAPDAQVRHLQITLDRADLYNLGAYIADYLRTTP